MCPRVARFLYDYLKESGPTSVTDAGLLAIASELPSHCQELIVQYGSLEAFLTRSVASDTAGCITVGMCTLLGVVS